jgi:enamine deaminase RidA (YjgF/YER057c/UK114 family)
MLSLMTTKDSDVMIPNHDGFQARSISAMPDGLDDLSVFDAFPPESGSVAAQLVFGGCAFYPAARDRMNGVDWPLLWLQGDVCPGTHISGTQALVIEGPAPRRITLGNRVVGSTWSDAGADYCLLAGIRPTDISERRELQAQSCFEQIEAALEQAGMDFSNVVRTWLYLDDLLAWYGKFNAVRTRFFKRRGVFEGLIPASTGIGAGNPAGAALAAGVFAIRPRCHDVHVYELDSPLQRPATEYRSSFSRAIEIVHPVRRTLMISGTASIAPDGGSMFAGDVVRQIHRTLDVVEAILHSRGMTWRDTGRAVAYFHDIHELAAFDECCRQRGIPRLPMVPAHATICRPELLFELELDATVTL